MISLHLALQPTTCLRRIRSANVSKAVSAVLPPLNMARTGDALKRRLGMRALPPQLDHDISDSSDTQTQQVALFAMLPIALLTIKWVSSSGPAAWAAPFALLAVPVVGTGMRDLLKGGYNMARWWMCWARSHQSSDASPTSRYSPPHVSRQPSSANAAAPIMSSKSKAHSSSTMCRVSVPQGDHAVQDTHAGSGSATPQGPYSTWPRQGATSFTYWSHQPAAPSSQAHAQPMTSQHQHAAHYLDDASRSCAHQAPHAVTHGYAPLSTSTHERKSRLGSPGHRRSSVSSKHTRASLQPDVSAHFMPTHPSMHGMPSLASVELVDLDWPADNSLEDRQDVHVMPASALRKSSRVPPSQQMQQDAFQT